VPTGGPARASSSRPIFERPGKLRRFASAYSSWRVLGDDAPLRLRRATAAPCLPRAVRVLAGRLAIAASCGLLRVPSYVAFGGGHLLSRRHERQRPTARSSSALVILERPEMFFSRASL